MSLNFDGSLQRSFSIRCSPRREYRDQFVMGAYCLVDSSSWRDVSSCTDAVKFIRDRSRCSVNKSVISMEIHPVRAGISLKHKNQ